MLIELFILVAVFIFGSIIGSFLNVVIYRYNTGKGLNGRSLCFSCGKTLRWYELVPVVSFMVQGGKCRGCSSKISWQYPAVEITSGLMFALIFFKEAQNSPLSLLYYLVIFSLLLVIVVYDFRHKIIPDGLVYTFAALSFLKLFVAFGSVGAVLGAGSFAGASFVVPSLSALLAGPLLFLPFFLLWAVSKGRWIGLGDGKLALGVGWFLGLLYGGSALIYSFWIGCIVSLLIILFTNGRLGLKSEIPFAPFIILSVFLVYYFHISINDLILVLQNYGL